MSVSKGNANKASALSCPIHSSCQPYIPLPALEPEAGEKSSFLAEKKNGAPFLVSSFEPLGGRNRSGGGKLPGDRILSFIPTHESVILHSGTRPLQPWETDKCTLRDWQGARGETSSQITNFRAVMRATEPRLPTKGEPHSTTPVVLVKCLNTLFSDII